MNKTIFSLMILSLMIGGCSFGEYADNEDKTTQKVDNNGTTYQKFTQKNIENKTLYKVSKPDENWSMIEYDFNVTHYKANQIKGGESSLSGSYDITDEGYLKLESVEATTYVKGIEEDKEKISLLWTKKVSDLNKTKATKDTYFFKTKSKADEFIK